MKVFVSVGEEVGKVFWGWDFDRSAGKVLELYEIFWPMAGIERCMEVRQSAKNSYLAFLDISKAYDSV